MGYIYKLTNLINNKVYIGQTRTSLKARMSKHFNRPTKNGFVTGVDGAIKKYGRDNFKCTVICKCDNEELNDLEIYYIQKYKSNNPDFGYNLTIGGDNSWSYLGLKDEEVISKYMELKSIKKVASYYGCSVSTISDILHENNVELFKPTGNIDNLKSRWGKPGILKSVKIIELDKVFNSIIECSNWLIENGYCKAKYPKYVSKSICRILKKKTSAKKYHGLTIVYN